MIPNILKRNPIEENKHMPMNNFVVRYIRTHAGILLGLLALCVFLTFATDSFFQMNNIMNVLRQVCINVILAFAMTYVLIIGGIDLSVGSVLAATGVVVVTLIGYGVPLYAAIPLAMLLGAFFGFMNGLVISRTGIPPFIVTLATATIIRGLSYVFTSGKPIQSQNKVFNFIGNGYVGPIPVPVIIVAIIMIIVMVILNKTKFGRHMYAIGGNLEAAVYSGINVKKVQLLVYTLCGTLAGIAGIIQAARMYSGQPTVGQGFEGDAIAASVLGGTSFTGGIGTIGGTLIGALVIGVLNNGLNLLKISFYWQLVIKGLVIIGAVYIEMIKKKKRRL